MSSDTEEVVPSSQTSDAPKLEDTLADYQPPKRAAKKQEKDDAVGPSVFITGGAGANNLCKRCNKRVYEMEKMIADKDIYHKLCFRCLHCKRILSLGNFAAIDGAPYCKPHFIELFKKKGRYDMASAKPRSDVQNNDIAEVNLVQTSVPTISNTERQSRMGGYDDQEQASGEIKREEPVRFQQMSSVRNMFESASRTSSVSPTPPKHRFTDKPRESVPSRAAPREVREERREEREVVREVVREDELTEKDDMPPPAITRNLVARFRELEQSGGETYIPDRKPVHKITPPRDELAHGIDEALAVHSQHEPPQYQPESPQPDIIKSGEEPNPANELPPPQFTRHMLAKFKSMEEINPVSVSPEKVTTVQRSVSLRTTPPAGNQRPVVSSNHGNPRQMSRASPDSGIMDVDLHVVNGHRIVESEPEQEPENELPEEGFTRSLVAKWRCIEDTSPAPTPSKPSVPPAQQHHPEPHYTETHYTETPQYKETQYKENNHYEDDNVDELDGRHITRESDTNEEEYLPPPSFTRNMLAKFQTLEAEAEKQAQEQSIPAKKQYKWSVKEAPLISGSGMVWQEKRRSSSADDDLNYQDYQHQEHYDNDDHEHYDDHREHYDNDRGERYDDAEPIYDDELYDDVIRPSDMRSADQSSQHIAEELPPQAYTQSVLAKFRMMEDVDRPPPSPKQQEQQQQRPSYVSTSSNRQPSPSHLVDLSHEDQYNAHYYDDNIHSEEEEDAFHDPDIVRETDVYSQDELPEIGTTRSLLSKFQSIQAQ